ncbi:MAG: AI-2E family transporter [Planctomycetota bacterium]
MIASTQERKIFSLTTEVAIRLALLTALVTACLHLLWPFVLPVIWGVVIAIAVWPMVRKLSNALGGRHRTAAALFALIAIAALVIPTWLLAESVTKSLIAAGEHLVAGDTKIPPPPEKIGELPLVGKKLEAAWNKAVANPTGAIHSFAPQIKAVGHRVLALVAGIGFGVLQFVFSIILAAVFLATASGGAHAANALGERLAGERGRELVETATKTVSSVVKGVLGVAVVQAVGALIGMLLLGVPGAGVWALVILLFAIVQLPPALVLLPMIFYAFSIASTFGAVAFTIWAVIVSVSDTFLKPLFLGRGVEVPMLVILIGAIGGMLAWGVLGLFVGAVVLALGYELSRAWFQEPELAPQPESAQG